MQLTTLLTAAGLAVTNTNAFLLPFSDAAADDIVTTLPVPVGADAAPFRIAAVPGAEFHNVMISCPGCGPRVRGPHMLDTSPPQLELNFSIAHAANADHLLVNDFQLYPKPALAAMRSEPLKARVLHPNKELPEHMNDRHHHPEHARRLSFSVHTRKVAHSVADNLDLVEVHLDILQVGQSPVQLPTVELKLIKGVEGGLMIGDVALKVFKMPANIEDCTSFFCRWRMTVMQAFRRLRLSKPCHGSSREGASQGGHQLEQPPHVHHGHRASWGQLLKNIGAHILLPVAIGIVAGVAASVLGMMVGTVIVCLWRTFFRPASRRHHRRHSCHRAAKTEIAAAADEEKSSLMAHQDIEEEIDAPPAYADDKKPETESA